MAKKEVNTEELKNDIQHEIKDLEDEIDELREEVIELEDKYESLECNENVEDYEAMLDDCYGEVKIAGGTYATSHALKIIDEIAFDCGMNDWNSGELDNLNDEIESKTGEIKSKEDEIDELNGKLEGFDDSELKG